MGDLPPEYGSANGNRARIRPVGTEFFKKLGRMRIVLASASPRRFTLLSQIGIYPEVVPSNFAEDLDKYGLGPIDYCRETAAEKAMLVYKSMIEEEREVKLVIGADTIVVTSKGEILEKPKSDKDHISMLRKLRDTGAHSVMTGICCIAPLSEPITPGYSMKTDVVTTEVKFDETLPDEMIEAYVADGEARDAAGGYEIQGKGVIMIESIQGDYCNVVGLPLQKLVELIDSTIHAEAFDADLLA